MNGCLFNQERAGRAGVPLYAYPISSPTELTQGDHILYLSSIAPNRPTFRSALVVFALKDAINLVTYTKEGVRLQEVKFSNLHRVSRVEYTMCQYSRKKAIQRAKGRLKMKEKHYHPLFNNSHFFVSWSKTGKQYPLSVIVQNLLYDEGMSNLIRVAAYTVGQFKECPDSRGINLNWIVLSIHWDSN